jgi:hypothetical protein
MSGLVKFQMFWFCTTSIVATIMYFTDKDSHYQVIGLFFLFFYSLVLNLLFLLIRYLYLVLRKKKDV